MSAGPWAGAAGTSRERGIVLVTVIWLLALLGGLTMAMSLYTTNVLSAIDVYNDRPRAEAALEAGLNQAVAAMLGDDAKARPAVTMTSGDARITYAWSGETARLDVNLAPPDLLASLFVQLGAASDAAAGYAGRIVALRGVPAALQQAVQGHPPGYDPDEETPAAIAAAARGGVAPPGAPDPHKPFVDVVQLQQIPGFPAALMARAAPFLTTFSGIAQIDPHLASREVIAALPGLTRERLRTILAVRDSADETALDDALGEAKAYTTDKRTAATRIKVKAVLADGFTAGSEIVIVHYPDDREPYRVLSWDDDPPGARP